MSTLIWKELRENLKWALLAMLVLAGAELYALRHTAMMDSYFDDGMTLTRRGFLTVTTFGPAIIGFCLGLLQIVPELPRDRWAALLHRPMPRGRILLGKIAAGLLLYVIAVVPPFLLCAWHAATPGHFPSPFVPGLALAGLADNATGVVYYFAALIVALQRGGPVLLRGLPALAAIHVSYWVVGAYEFSHALWAVILMAATMGVAAWGTMYHMDSFGARPWLGKVASLIVAFFGLSGAADIGSFVLNAGQRYGSDGSNYQLSDADRPLRVNYLNGAAISVQELDGTTPASADFRPEHIRDHTRHLNNCTFYIGDSHQWHPPWFDESYRAMRRYVQPGRAYSYPRVEQWFYLVKERSFIGMSIRNKVAIGRLDQQGFQPPSAAPTPLRQEATFSPAERDAHYLLDPTGMRYANFARQQITEVALPLPGPVSGLISIYVQENHVPLLAVALSTGLAIYEEKDRKLVTTLPYHQNAERWGSIGIGSNAAEDRFYLRYDPSEWIPEEEKDKMPSFMEVVDARGEVLHSYTLPPLPQPPKPRRWGESVRECLQAPALFFGGHLYQKVGAALEMSRVQQTMANRFAGNSPLTMRTATYLTLLSFLCACVTLCWARRAQMSWTQAWAWAAFALAFNLAGLLVFWLVADRPQLVPCTACGHARPVKDEHCPHCARSWPPPPPNGTEIVDYPPLNGFVTKPTA